MKGLLNILVVAILLGCGLLVRAAELPSGSGLAAEFDADQEVIEHPAVIFAENFESDDYRTRWDEARDKDGKVLSVVDPKSNSLGKRCLKVTATLGENTGGGLTKWFESNARLFIRFYTKFDEGADYIHHFVTLRANRSLRGRDRWSGFGGAGLKPDGTERFSTALEPWGDWGRNPAPGKWNFYSYWHEMKPAPDGKYWGNSFKPGEQPNIEKGKWICAEFMIQHNTPGKMDGEQAFWIDGKLMGHWKGISWRTSPTLWANALTLESYVTDRWTKNRRNTVYFDNVVVASKYIGPAP
jgi:hypothetical protein